MNMNLDIKGKVGIRNALELLEKEFELAKDDLNREGDKHRDLARGLEGYIQAIEKAIKIVKLNITNSDK